VITLKTTVIINDDVLIKAKVQCIKEKTNLSKVINELLLAWIESSEEVETPKLKQEKAKTPQFSAFSEPQRTFRPFGFYDED
jgi:hypothetical protein